MRHPRDFNFASNDLRVNQLTTWDANRRIRVFGAVKRTGSRSRSPRLESEETTISSQIDSLPNFWRTSAFGPSPVAKALRRASSRLRWLMIASNIRGALSKPEREPSRGEISYLIVPNIENPSASIFRRISATAALSLSASASDRFPHRAALL